MSYQILDFLSNNIVPAPGHLRTCWLHRSCMLLLVIPITLFGVSEIRKIIFFFCSRSDLLMNSRLCIVFMVSSPCIQLSSSSVTTSVRFRYACHLFEVISEWSLVHLDFIQSCYGAQCAFWSCCVLIPLSRCCQIRAKHSSTMSQLCFFCV